MEEKIKRKRREDNRGKKERFGALREDHETKSLIELFSEAFSPPLSLNRVTRTSSGFMKKL